jgi:hypothetical protein
VKVMVGDCSCARTGTALVARGWRSLFLEHGVDQPFELLRPRPNAAVGALDVESQAVQFIADIEGRDDGDAQRVGAGQFASGRRHLLVEEMRQITDILRVEVASHRIPLPVNLDVDDGAGHGGFRD